MFADRPPDDVFFGRLQALDIECPRCARVVRLDDHTRVGTWNRSTARFRCPQCGLRLAFGVIAYPLAPGDTAPPATAPDAQPTYRQAMALRREYPARLSTKAVRVRSPRNVVIREACCCERMPMPGGGTPASVLFVNPACPVHGHTRLP